MDRHLVVAFAKIELGEYSASCQAGGQIGDVWARVAIFFSLQIKLSKIATWPPRPVRLANHM
jgi:hypothetical protein